jgi:hypothetical protein
MRWHCRPVTLVVLAVSTSLSALCLLWISSGGLAHADNYAYRFEAECTPKGSHPCPGCEATAWIFTCGDTANEIPKGYQWGNCTTNPPTDCRMYTRFCGAMAYNCFSGLEEPNYASECGASGNYCKTVTP